MTWTSITIRVEATGPEDLLKVLNSLKGRCDHLANQHLIQDYEIAITKPEDPIIVERDSEV